MIRNSCISAKHEAFSALPAPAPLTLANSPLCSASTRPGIETRYLEQAACLRIRKSRANLHAVPGLGATVISENPSGGFYRGSMSFSHLGLSDKVLAAVAATGYTIPTPIQEQAIPHVLARRDVLGIAQTGTGKTAAFVLPMLTMLEKGRARARMPRTLILEPTRELAAQVKESFDKYGAGQKLNVALLIGGVSFGDQDSKLTRGVDVLIATPGRLLDHTERGGLLLTGVELLVIDEADRMLDMGFIPDIERICKLVPFTRQTLFFTATMPPEIRRITETFLHNPEKIEVSRPATTAVGVAQFQVGVGREPHEKRDTLRRLLRDAKDLQNAIIFCNRKREVALLYKSLQKHGLASAPCTATWISRRAPPPSTSSARVKFPSSSLP